MHRVRKNARREAWSDPNNPFGKVSSQERRQLDDEETGRRPRATTHQSDSVAFSNSKRREPPNSLPQKASTLPVSPRPPSGPSHFAPFSENDESDKHGEQSRGSGEDTSDTCSHDVYNEPEKVEEEEEPEQHNRNMNGILGNPNAPVGKPTLRQRFRALGKKNTDNNEKKPSKTGSGMIHISKDHKWGQYPFTLWGQIKNTIFNSWINILLIAVPVGIALNYVKIDPVGIFVVNFVAIVPLAAMLSYATEEIAMHTGETIGGLLNASFGNAVELIVSIVALTQPQPEIVIVQTSLIGSILSNLLLVLGMCFFFGGINRPEQHFNVVVAQTAASLLALAVGSIIIPAAFNAWSSGTEEVQQIHIAQLSRGTAVLLLFVYACYLFFQLKTHISMFNEPSKKVEKRKKKQSATAAQKGLAAVAAPSSARNAAFVPKSNAKVDPEKPDDRPTSSETLSEDGEEKEHPQLFIWVAVLTLCVSTAFVGLCAEFMVSSINDLTERANLSKTFVGLILLPIVGNAAEHATAVTVACKDKMDLAIGVAVGSSMQIALLVIPFVVVLGWILGIEEMTLDFDGYQVAVLFVTVLLVNYLIQDGKSHWLEGILLLTLYLIISISAWFYPAKEDPTGAAKLRFI